MSMDKQILLSILRDTCARIERNECGLDDEEITEIARILCHHKLTEEQVCNRKHISRATLSRRILSGEYPPPHKEPGGKKYYYWDEIKDL